MFAQLDVALISHGSCLPIKRACTKHRHSDCLIKSLGEGVDFLSVGCLNVLRVFHKRLQITHVFQDLAIAIARAVLRVEPVLDQAFFRVKLV